MFVPVDGLTSPVTLASVSMVGELLLHVYHSFSAIVVSGSMADVLFVPVGYPVSVVTGVSVPMVDE